MNRDGIRTAFPHTDFDIQILTTAWQGMTAGIVAGTVHRVSPSHFLISVRKGSYMHQAIEGSGVFAISLLGQSQIPVVAHIAYFRGNPAWKFDNIPTMTRVSGAPILRECKAFVDCRLTGAADVGDFTAFVGEIVDGDLVNDEPTLNNRDLMASEAYQAASAAARQPRPGG
ncbi:MAG: flavin reductase family protein [Chloroflexi bacterium]|nr:flavin reductase family protein [Chloroflexota bacterium]